MRRTEHLLISGVCAYCLEARRHAKIGDRHGAILAHQHIFGFQIAVHDAVRVDLHQGSGKLRKYRECLARTQGVLQSVLERAARKMLHRQVRIGSRETVAQDLHHAVVARRRDESMLLAEALKFVDIIGGCGL